MTELSRKRYAGHSAFTSLVKADWISAIKLDPDMYEAFLYLPSDEATSDGDNYEEMLVEQLDTNQETLTYQDPVVVPVVDCPDENESFLMLNDSSEGLGESELPLMLRVGFDAVPVGSVLEWEEELSTGDTRRVWWYVHKAMGYGASNVGAIYVCIPMRDFDQNGSTSPVIEDPVIEAEAIEPTNDIFTGLVDADPTSDVYMDFEVLGS